MVRSNRNYIVLLIFLFCTSILAQPPKSTDNMLVRPYKIDHGDTVIVARIKEIFIYPPHNFSRNEYRKYRKLIRDIKKVYPYALIAKKVLIKLNKRFVELESEKERQAYIDMVEEKLTKEFEAELRKMTISQGRLLIKLIDREIGSTSYEIVKEMKGSFSAFFWQAVAKFFGSDLKTGYDPYGEDRIIEEILIKIKYGQL